ncbi:hypothetical protein J2W96_007371 [Variovorax guangxiensis]|nr:hypothetical protein [Variovorax guangxiensis]
MSLPGSSRSAGSRPAADCACRRCFERAAIDLPSVGTPGKLLHGGADLFDLTLMAALTGVEMGLKLAGVPLAASGVAAAMDFFAATPQLKV